MGKGAMKRALLAVVPMACLSTSPMAQDVQNVSNSELPHSSNNTRNHFEGFFIGAEGGILNSFANIDSTTTASYTTTEELVLTPEADLTVDPSDDIAVFAQSGTLTSSGQRNSIYNFGTGAVSIGYGKFISNSKKMYLGCELALNIAKRKNILYQTAQTNNQSPAPSEEDVLVVLTDNNVLLSTKTQADLGTAELDLDIKPGYALTTDWLAYLRFGAAFNRLAVKSDNSLTIYDAYGTSTTSTSVLHNSSTKNIVGFRFGLGSEHYVTPKISVKFDYTYTWFGDQSTHGARNVQNTFDGSTTINGLINNASAKMSNQMAMVGLNYYFDIPATLIIKERNNE